MPNFLCFHRVPNFLCSHCVPNLYSSSFLSRYGSAYQVSGRASSLSPQAQSLRGHLNRRGRRPAAEQALQVHVRKGDCYVRLLQKAGLLFHRM